MRCNPLWLLAALALAPLWLACPSVSTMGSARTLQAGALQGFVGPGLYAATSSSSPTVTLPQIEGGIRYGVTDRVELGAKFWLLGFNVEGKFALFRPESPDEGVNLSIAPGLGYLTLGDSTAGTASTSGVLNLYVPVLLGIRLRGHELIFAPKLIDTLVFGTSTGGAGTGNILSFGASLGFAVKLADGFRIVPEIAVLYPAILSDTSTGTSTFGRSLVFQGGIGFLFGGAEERRAPVSSPEEWQPPPAP